MSRSKQLEGLYFLRKELYSLKREICIIQINRKLDEMTEKQLPTVSESPKVKVMTRRINGKDVKVA